MTRLKTELAVLTYIKCLKKYKSFDSATPFHRTGWILKNEWRSTQICIFIWLTIMGDMEMPK